MTVNQFQFKRRIYSYVKSKQQTFKLNYLPIKYITMCISCLYACQYFFRWWNATRNHHQQHDSHSGTWIYKRTHKCWISFKWGGGVYFIRIPCNKLFIKSQLPLLATRERFCSKWFCSLRRYHRSRCLSVRIRHFRLTREINQLKQEIPVVKRRF